MTTTASTYIKSATTTLLKQGFTRSSDSFTMANGSELSRMSKCIKKFSIVVELSNFAGINARGDLFEVSLFADRGKSLKVSYSGAVEAASLRGQDVFSMVADIEDEIALSYAD